MIEKWGSIMGFTIATDYPLPTTQVPDWFILTYMPTANGNFVKTYLYLLMLCQHPEYKAENTIRNLADCMECTESDILCALRFWKKEHLLDYTEKDGVIVSIIIKNQLQGNSSIANEDTENADNLKASDIAEQPASPVVPFPHSQSTPMVVIPEKQNYTPLQSEALMHDAEISQTISSVEQLLGTTISATHLQLILYFMCDIGFSRELIIAMYETALKKGKNSPRYIEAIGISWAKQGIKTATDAEQEAAAFHGRYSLVAKVLGIQRSLAPAERAIIDEWLQYHFSDDIIEEACKRTVLQTGGANLQYASGILENWAKQNVISLSDIEQCDEAYRKQKKEKSTKRIKSTPQNKNQFQNFPQRNYSEEDYNSLEKQLLRNAHAEA